MRPPDGSPKVVGLSIRRIEDERLLTGRGRFTDNLRFEGQAYAAIVRSPHAHAEVLSIGKSAAETVDGVLGVFVAADLEAEGIGPLPFFRPFAASTADRSALLHATLWPRRLFDMSATRWQWSWRQLPILRGRRRIWSRSAIVRMKASQTPQWR